ncbi:MAG: nuclear transport factor 2 family protein [Thermomicrobiales bacterium]
MSTVESTRAEIERLSIAWMDAVRRHDREALERFLGAEFMLQAPDLGRVPRQAWLDAAMGAYQIREFEIGEIDTQVYGEIAVMRAKSRQVATWAGADRSRVFYLTDVWILRDGDWRVVSRHSSYAPE